MQQKRLTLLKRVLMAVLILGIGFGCKKNGTITPPPVVTPESLGFKLIPAGTFTMGSATGVGDDDEHPQRQVTVSAFYLDSTELTRKKFLPFLQSKDTNYLALNQRKITDYTITGWSETDAHPVVNISWFSTVAYCNWLTKQTGFKDTCYTFTLNGDGTIKTVNFDRTKHGYRLPTEAEWEYACRGGTTTAYSCGDGITPPLGDYAWYSVNSANITHPVGSKKSNPFGLRDTHGNVWEWVWDWYPAGAPYYDVAQTNNPTGPTTGSFRVIRGGSWGSDAADLRSAFRNVGTPVNRLFNIGFRLAKTL